LEKVKWAYCVNAIILLCDENVQLMHCVALSTSRKDIDVDCYPVCKFYANYFLKYNTVKDLPPKSQLILLSYTMSHNLIPRLTL